MPQPSLAIRIDDRLHWVLRPPESPIAAARASSPQALQELTARFEEPQPEELMDRLIDAAARIVAAALADLPALPFIGEPFGGEDATD